jgi:predicted metal-dependent hydrolase
MDPLTIALIVSAVSAGVTAIASKQASDAAEEAMLAENDRAVKERKAMFEREERERAARRGATTSFSPTQGGQSVLGSTPASSQSNNTTILGS